MSPKKTRKDHSPAEFMYFESQLQKSFQPVQPNPAFIDQLRTKLLTTSTMTLETPRRTGEIILTVALVLTIISVSLLLGLRLHKRLFPNRPAI